MSQSHYFKLVHRKSPCRAGTAVLMFPGMIPTYSDLDGETKLFSRFGDVLEFHYPEKNVAIEDLYRDVTAVIKKFRYRKLILLGMSFGGTLAYLLMRYWHKHRLNLGLSAFVAVSAPFQPEDLTPRSQFELDLGATLDRYARKALIRMVRLLKFIWRFSLGSAWRYGKESSLRQTMNGIRLGYILRQDWVVRNRLLRTPALLLNVSKDKHDPFVRHSNERNFLDIFPRGRVLEVLNCHSDINGVPPAISRRIVGFLRATLR